MKQPGQVRQGIQDWIASKILIQPDGNYMCFTSYIYTLESNSNKFNSSEVHLSSVHIYESCLYIYEQLFPYLVHPPDLCKFTILSRVLYANTVTTTSNRSFLMLYMTIRYNLYDSTNLLWLLMTEQFYVILILFSGLKAHI